LNNRCFTDRSFRGLRREEHEHITSFKLCLLFDRGDLGDGFGKTSHDLFTDLGVSHFAAAETDGDLYFVSVLEEAVGVVYLGVEIIGVDVEGKSDLLGLDDLLVLPVLLLLLGLLETELTVVHYLADGRSGLRSDLDEIKIPFGGEYESLSGRHYAELVSVGADETDLTVADLLINAVFLTADGKAPLSDKNSARAETVRARQYE